MKYVPHLPYCKQGVLELVRRSNCSAPTLREIPWVRRKICVIKKGGALGK